MAAKGATAWLKSPLWLLGLARQDKSFTKNPILGSPSLNRRGLHRERVRLAAKQAEHRRRTLARFADPAQAAAYDRDGYVAVPDALPPDVFERIRAGLTTIPLPAREMRQGEAVTRMIPLGPAALAAIPDLAGVVHSPIINGIIRYVAGCGGEPLHFVQTVIAEPGRGGHDPQTELHSDTFHSTAKMWLFLQDVGEDDGPFTFVPGSHRLTPERLDWEYRTSLTAASDPRGHHAHGSFRVTPEELRQLGDFVPRRVTVKANTMVVADTYAFHARTPSPKPTLRMELHAYLRGNPFSPFAGAGGGLSALPGLRDRRLPLYLGYKDAMKRWTGANHVWRDVGPSTADAPAHV